ncbi:MAG TPA: 4-hydroxyphenylpyruvate dioxygenase [Streptosporangiaceae bacterium]|jgi:4-hydroxymandelate synthase
MRIQGIDHVEYYTGDIEQAADRLCNAFSFRIHGAKGGPGSAPGGERSLLLRHGDIQILLTTSMTPGHPAAEFVRRHGDGVGSIAFRADDVQAAYGQVVANGAEPVRAPSLMTGQGSQVTVAVVAGFGDVTHKLVQRSGPADEFAPGSIEMTRPAADEGILSVLDHVAVCLPAGGLDATVEFYRDVFGLSQIFDERIEVGGQAMLSKVVQDESAAVTFTLIEPDLTREPGQIDEFLAAHGGAGVQHLAFRTGDIAGAIRTLSARGVEFLTAPAGYFASLPQRLGQLAIPVAQLQELNILADRDRWGEMFQIFSLSAHERNTFFIELIERQGALTFGSRNIKALYEALERQHATAGQLT